MINVWLAAENVRVTMLSRAMAIDHGPGRHAYVMPCCMVPGKRITKEIE